MRVAENGATDRAGRTGPGFEACGAMHDRPAYKPVDRNRGVGPDVRLINTLNVAAFGMKDEASNAGVGNQHIRTTAQDRDGNGGFARELERHDNFVAAARLEEPVSGA